MSSQRLSSFSPSALAIFLIRVYQVVISPVLRPACRFEPSCSQYSLEAIARHGLRRGAALGLRRLWRCRPGVPCGLDPVP
ncbi:MAG: membrane protein insertion efficiency factor YidD [bacterium]